MSLGTAACSRCSIRQSANVSRMTASSMSLRWPAVPQAGPQQQLPAGPQDPPQLGRVPRPVARGQVVKAAPVQGGVQAVSRERQPARVGPQERRAAVFGGGPAHGHC